MNVGKVPNLWVAIEFKLEPELDFKLALEFDFIPVFFPLFFP